MTPWEGTEWEHPDRSGSVAEQGCQGAQLPWLWGAEMAKLSPKRRNSKTCRKALGRGDRGGCSQHSRPFGVDWREDRTGEVSGKRDRGQVGEENMLQFFLPCV